MTLPQLDRPLIYYSRLSLENVRTFANRQEIRFDGDNGRPYQWTLILGENGVGKTTLLQCLSRLRPVLPIVSENEFYQPSVQIEPELASEEKNEVLASFVRKDTKEDVKLEAIFSLGVGFDSKLFNAAIADISTSLQLMKVSNGNFDDFDYGGRFEYPFNIREPLILNYGASRIPIRSTDSIRSAELDSNKPVFEDVTKLVDAETLLHQLDYARLKGNESAESELRWLKQILAEILPDISSPEDIEIHDLPELNSYSKPAGVMAKTPYGTVPLNQLSFGYQIAISWIVDIAWNLIQFYPSRRNPFKESAIVLVDEIDLHLHPQWQREIRQVVTNSFPNIQFIVTSHNPIMVQNSLDTNLVVLRREEDRTVIDTDLVTVNEWRLDQVMTSKLFGFELARNPETEEKFIQLNQLSGKTYLTNAEQMKLKALEDWALNLPTAESRQDRQAMAIIREVAKIIEQVSDNDRNS